MFNHTFGPISQFTTNRGAMEQIKYHYKDTIRQIQTMGCATRQLAWTLSKEDDVGENGRDCLLLDQ